jgi:hypothetical protein
MNKISLAVLVLALLAMTVSAQQRESCGTKAGILLAKDKPTIYITFERAGKVKPTPIRLAATDTSPGQSDDQNSESIQVVWLRLHNNTRWAINFPTDSLYVGPKITPIRLCDGRGALGLRTDIEVNVRYEVEAVSGYESVRTSDGGLIMNSPVDAAKPPVINRSDMFSTSWLPPGGSVIFSVPREHLTERLAIYIPYNYEWEYGERIFRSDEPQHRVYFRASDLPEKVQTKTK